MKGNDIVSALMKKFKVSSSRELAKKIGLTPQAIQNWKNRDHITSRQIAGLVHSANKVAARSLEQNAIRPLVEFFHIEKHAVTPGGNHEVFNIKKENKDIHPYLKGLREELEKYHGVYVFYDSRGHAIYVGKARQQSLWKEINGVFNRKRDEKLQSIKRVSHPIRNQPYRTSDEKARQITDHKVLLHELAFYFSAYHVVDGMIGEVEAMLVRSFANDLLNKRMERFVNQRKQKKNSRIKKAR